MTTLDVAELFVGFLIIVIMLFDVFTSVVVPRPVRSIFRVSALFARLTWPLWRGAALRMPSPQRREQVLGIFGPFAIMAFLAIWEIGLLLGFGLVFFALRRDIHPMPENLSSAIYFSGSSLLTIGYGDYVPVDGSTRFMALAAATTGLATLAIVLAFLFFLFGSFQQRELFVVSLDARAGAPPSGVSLLETHAQLGLTSDLPRLFQVGQNWAALVLDSHLAYPLLCYFRSSHVDISWLAALGAMLDAATLVISSVEGVPKGQAVIMHSMGTHLTEDLAHYFFFTPTSAVEVERSEYRQARQRLQAAGFALVEEEAGWTAFQRLRGGYAHALNDMARFWAITPAQWIGDRSVLSVRHA